MNVNKKYQRGTSLRWGYPCLPLLCSTKWTKCTRLIRRCAAGNINMLPHCPRCIVMSSYTCNECKLLWLHCFLIHVICIILVCSVYEVPSLQHGILFTSTFSSFYTILCVYKYSNTTRVAVHVSVLTNTLILQGYRGNNVRVNKVNLK